jgi:dTMP kinase
MTGRLIAFEGGEGSGKSTQVARLAATIPDALVTRQPGGTPVGQIIRGLLLDPNQEVCDRAEALLYAADRAQHVDDVIRPALAAGQTVICDRWVDSSIAYQAYGRGESPARIGDLSAWATGGLIPDLTVLLDINPTIGLARAARRSAADRLEREGLSFHWRVRDAYLTLANATPGRYLVLDATRPVDELAGIIAARVHNLTSQEIAA